MNKDKKKTILIYFLFYVFTIISAIVAVVLYLKYFPTESKVITETVNKTMVSEQGIEEAISGVFNVIKKDFDNGLFGKLMVELIQKCLVKR